MQSNLVYFVYKLSEEGSDKVDEVESLELFEALYREKPDANNYYCMPMFINI